MPNEKCDANLTVRLPSGLLEKLKGMARKARRDLSDYVRVTLEDHADDQPEKR